MRVSCQEMRERISLAAVVSRTVKLRRAGDEWTACCPFHADRTPSFTIYADDSRFMCFGCGAEGDVIDFVRRVHRVSLAGALDMLGREEGTAFVDSPERVSCGGDRSPEAAAIWSNARHVAGTAVEAYLGSRGIHGPFPDCIRSATLSPGRERRLPTLVAAVSTLAGEVFGIQRTFLQQDGLAKAALPGGKAKLSLGRIRGGAIRVTPPGAELVLTEGLEDGLTVQQITGMPVWVAAGATMLPLIELPSLGKTVVIAADTDVAGLAAAEEAARVYSRSGRSVRIIRPSAPYKDFNEQLQDQAR